MAKRTKDRNIVIVDRGWIFAGDVEERGDRIHLYRAVWVVGWKDVGFSKVCEDAANAEVRPMPDVFPSESVNIPLGAEVFRVPVGDEWGLKEKTNKERRRK